MDDEDFLFLIGVVEEQLREIGAAELARESNYVIHDGDTGVVRLLQPQLRLLGMLQAFERFMAVRDWTTYVDSLERMDVSTEGRSPQGAVIVPFRSNTERAQVDLAASPDLSEPRAMLRALIERLSGREFGPPFTDL